MCHWARDKYCKSVDILSLVLHRRLPLHELIQIRRVLQAVKVSTFLGQNEESVQLYQIAIKGTLTNPTHTVVAQPENCIACVSQH